MSKTYSPNGLGHRVLEKLEAGRVPMGELQKWAQSQGPAAEKGHPHVMRAMLIDGLVTCRGGIYALDGLGVEALADLRAGKPFVTHPAPAVPNARVFVRFGA